MEPKRMRLLVVAIAVLVVSSGLMMVFFDIWLHPVSVVQVALVGDSLTELTHYPVYLQIMLGMGYRINNFGATGATVLQSADRPYINQTALQNATESLPDVVIIMLGTNDARTNIYLDIDSFVGDYKELISEFQNLTSKPAIWLVKPPPIFENNLSLSNDNLVEGVIPRIDEVASELGLRTIDVYSALANHPEYFADGVHPTDRGAKAIATAVHKAIT